MYANPSIVALVVFNLQRVLGTASTSTGLRDNSPPVLTATVGHGRCFNVDNYHMDGSLDPVLALCRVDAIPGLEVLGMLVRIYRFSSSIDYCSCRTFHLAISARDPSWWPTHRVP
ncbi:hypothetical protein PLICRDRAFT_52683 [Plicaturopsis crispa FD-325 SS-3]|nr:hypothetical protein PLICRDRAFT_52683 [Plicaturopsis crispa FD-325 SS-3]